MIASNEKAVLCDERHRPVRTAVTSPDANTTTAQRNTKVPGLEHVDFWLARIIEEAANVSR